jgi:2-isopropylmalate synthase
MAVVTGIKYPNRFRAFNIEWQRIRCRRNSVGPVDAVLKAIQKLTSSIENIRLSEYRLGHHASNAVAEVVIKVEDEKGNIVSARAAREDIVMASVEAMINGINKLLLKNHYKQETKSEPP